MAHFGKAKDLYSDNSIPQVNIQLDNTQHRKIFEFKYDSELSAENENAQPLKYKKHDFTGPYI